MLKKKQNDVVWYDNANIITSLIIVIITMIIICSQAFVTVRSNSFSIFTSVINYNTIYLLALIYFLILKTKTGKKYFNYLNVFLLVVYMLFTVTSFLTIIQSFSLNTVFSFLVNLIVLIYFFHTMFRDTGVWIDYKLGNSPFNEIKNDYYFNSLIVIVAISLIVNLLFTVVISGLVISILDACYIALLARYIYLYREYLDLKKINIDNKGNFDAIKKDISDDLNELKDMTVSFTNDIKKKTDDFITENKIDEKLDNLKENVSNLSSEVKEKVDDLKDKVSSNSSLEDTEQSKKNEKVKKTKSKKKGDE